MARVPGARHGVDPPRYTIAAYDQWSDLIAAEYVASLVGPPTPVYPIVVPDAELAWAAMCGDWPHEWPSAYGTEPAGCVVTVDGVRSMALLADYEPEFARGMEVEMHKASTVSRLEAAKVWLEGFLESGPQKSRDVYIAAEQAGHAKATIQKAANELPIQKTRLGYGGDGYSEWSWNRDLQVTLDARLRERDGEAWARRELGEPFAAGEPVMDTHDPLVALAMAVTAAKKQVKIAENELDHAIGAMNEALREIGS